MECYLIDLDDLQPAGMTLLLCPSALTRRGSRDRTGAATSSRTDAASSQPCGRGAWPAASDKGMASYNGGGRMEECAGQQRRWPAAAAAETWASVKGWVGGGKADRNQNQGRLHRLNWARRGRRRGYRRQRQRSSRRRRPRQTHRGNSRRSGSRLDRGLPRWVAHHPFVGDPLYWRTTRRTAVPSSCAGGAAHRLVFGYPVARVT